MNWWGGEALEIRFEDMGCQIKAESTVRCPFLHKDVSEEPSNQPTQGYVLSAKESPFLSPPSKTSPAEQHEFPHNTNVATTGAVQQYQHIGQQFSPRPHPTKPRDPPPTAKPPGLFSQQPASVTAPSTGQQGVPPHLKPATASVLTNSVPFTKAPAPVRPPMSTAPSVSLPSSQPTSGPPLANPAQQAPQVPQTAPTANHSSNSSTVDSSRDSAPAVAQSSGSLQQQGHNTSSGNMDSLMGAKPLSQPGPHARGLQNAREEQLLRYVEQLKERLKASKSEAETLEQLLANAEARADERAVENRQLQGEVCALQEAKTLGENALKAQLAEQSTLLGEKAAKAEASARQVLRLQNEIESLKASSHSLAQSKMEMNEGMLEALKLQLEQADARLETERRMAAKAAAAWQARESDLEASLQSAGSALAETQHALEDMQTQAAALQDEQALLQAARRELQHRLQQAEAGQSGPLDRQGSSAAVSQLQAELSAQYAELERVKRSARAAEQGQADALGEVQVLRQRLKELAQKAPTAELEQQLRDTSEMLYNKQSQCERLASEKAAYTIKLERELSTALQELSKLRAGSHPAVMAGVGPSERSIALNVRQEDSIDQLQRFISRNMSRPYGAHLRKAAVAVKSRLKGRLATGRLLVFIYAFVVHIYLWVAVARLQACVETPKPASL
ncbi:hypothetical protein DUNSADRAFT_7815 [Dunaliella salina]|uniref:Golgin-84 n=1 Tax=Dunaliella salina TaxID=3046 RepID=A0ABQ7GKK1_DUNSA|nr:hypothetical protein DUNSADRAFT_7815 [Dunaliella salina]|eukprot:KAF5835140.1 hypothetical protein DUNSADRAFT_7815 [Dunaliella salina]